MADDNPWRWWAGSSEDEYRLSGPCCTREEAIDAAYGDTEPGDVIYVIEAVASDFDDGEGLFEFICFRNQSHVIREADAAI
jgi:hypothetical protein